MKKIHIALLASLACLFTVSCDKQEDDAPLYTTNSFKVEAPEFVDENGSKVYLQYTDLASSLIYEEGDQVYINGKSFTLVRDGGWRAVSSDGEPITGKRFLVTYVDGAVSNFDSAASTYQFNLNTTLASSANNKIILGGVAENAGDYVIKLKPACAILRINTKGAGSHYSYVKVGFDGNKIPKQGTVNVSNRTLAAGSNNNYMAAVAQGGYGDFLYMRYSDPSTTGEGDYWYVAIPIVGDDVTTTLYLEWNDGTTTVQHKTQSRVTLRKGYVYTLGTERQSPFTVTGVSKCSFNVNAGGSQIQFSAGNLQAKRTKPGSAWVYYFQFAPHQYDAIGSTNSSAIGATNQWFDLFGYGTSGYAAGQTARMPNSTSTSASDYINAAIYNTNSDWGKYLNYYYPTYKIFYGNTDAHSESWRTLRSEEWVYLINRSGKAGLATVSGIQGILLLPDSDEEGNDWVNNEYIPEGLSFTATFSNYSTNNYSVSDWDRLELAGAIFLPVTGYRSGTVVDNSSNGYYWSSSAPTSERPYPAPALVVTSSSASLVNTNRSWGCAVRLVVDVQELK